MTKNTRKQIGVMPCEGVRCKSRLQNVPVVVFQNDNDTLSYRCDYCQRAHYAKAGTDEHTDWMQDIKPMPGITQKGETGKPAGPIATPVASASVEKVATPAAPAVKGKSTVFG